MGRWVTLAEIISNNLSGNGAKKRNWSLFLKVDFDFNDLPDFNLIPFFTMESPRCCIIQNNKRCRVLALNYSQILVDRIPAYRN